MISIDGCGNERDPVSIERSGIIGRCLCGAIAYEFQGEPIEILHCHCESCRRHTSGVIATFVCVRTEAFRFTKGMPAAYVSSPGVTRTFCAGCGSPMTYASDRHPDQIDIYLGTLNDPAMTQPTFHVNAGEQLAWFETLDTLPRYERERGGARPVRYGPRRT